MQHGGIIKKNIYPLERVHVVTDFIIYTYVCNKNSLLFFESPVIHSVAPQNLHEPLFSYAPWSIAFSQKHLKTIIPWGANRVYYGRLQNSQLTNRPFSHDVTSAILVFQNNETAARWVSQTSPVGDEPFYFFCSNKFAKLLATWVKTLYSWFATTWQGGHVGGRYNRIFSRAIYMKIELSFQRREMVLFLTTNMAAVT